MERRVRPASRAYLPAKIVRKLITSVANQNLFQSKERLSMKKLRIGVLAIIAGLALTGMAQEEKNEKKAAPPAVPEGGIISKTNPGKRMFSIEKGNEKEPGKPKVVLDFVYEAKDEKAFQPLKAGERIDFRCFKSESGTMMATVPITHREIGQIVEIDVDQRKFTLNEEVEVNDAKSKATLKFTWHAVKDKYFVDLKPGDRVEVLCYTPTPEGPIASTCKVLK